MILFIITYIITLLFFILGRNEIFADLSKIKYKYEQNGMTLSDIAQLLGLTIFVIGVILTPFLNVVFAYMMTEDELKKIKILKGKRNE